MYVPVNMSINKPLTSTLNRSQYYQSLKLPKLTHFRDHRYHHHTTIKSTTETGMCQWRCLCHESRCCSGTGTLLQRLAAGRGTGIGLQHIGLQQVNDDRAQSAISLDGSRSEASSSVSIVRVK